MNAKGNLLLLKWKKRLTVGWLWVLLKKVSLGQCKLSEVMPRLMRSAGILGYFTNHLSAATRLQVYDATVNEDMIMQRTRHSSSQCV